ncbi:MAG: inositol monophosphatase family protein [Candidatus Bathyarchaeota archaeon]
MTNWLNIFREASEEIRRKVKPLLGSEKAGHPMGRGAGGDITKYIDLVAEEIVVKILEEKDTSCTLISEEAGVKKIGQDCEDYVILDSIDGTTNATRSIPFVATSIAHATGNQLTDVDVALIRDLYHNVTFSAKKGEGAFQDKKALSPSTINSLGKAIVAIDISCQEKLPTLMKKLQPVLCKTQKIRIMGSTALEVCYVASGALDAFIDLRAMTRAPDLAAAYLVLKEAGGETVTPSGEDLNMPLQANARTDFISASNKLLCNDILNSVKRIRK